MSGTIFKRCGCTITEPDESGLPKRRQVGASCPKLTRPGGSWSPSHGSWWFMIDVPAGAAIKRSFIRQGGHATRKEAATALDKVRELLAIGDGDEDPAAAKALIANLIRERIKAKAPLPDAEEIRRRTSLRAPLKVTTTVEQWLNEWLAARKHDLRPTTHLLYSQQVRNYLIPHLGVHRLDKLRAVHVRLAFEQIAADAHAIAASNAERHALVAEAKRAWHADDKAAAAVARAKLATMPPFRRPVNAASIQRIRAVLRSALTDAVNQQIVTLNVAKLVKLPSGRSPRPRVWTDARVEAWRATGNVPSSVMVWTAPQTVTFLHRAAKHRLFALYLLIAHCGLRRGEAVGLRWQDVNLDGASIEIRQQIVQIGWEVSEGDPKTDAGERSVMIAAPVVKALKAHRLDQEAQARFKGPHWTDSGLVFTDFDGTALHPAHVTDQFQILTREAGLPPIRLHDLRHGTATHALSAGVALKVVSEMLGHSTLGVTADLYTSVVDELKKSAADAIAEQFAA